MSSVNRDSSTFFFLTWLCFTPSYTFILGKTFPTLKGHRQNLTLRPSTVQFSHSVMFNSLRPHGLQHTRLPCPSPTPRVQTHVHQVSDAIQPSHPLSSPSPPALNISQHQGLFQWVSSSHQVAKILELQHQSFQWIFRVDFFRTDWFDILAVQGTLKSLLQHHSLKASILQHSAFFIVPLSYFTWLLEKP